MSSDTPTSKPRAAPVAPAVHAAHAADARWQVRLLGAVQTFDGTQHIERFPSRAVAALLARLALHPERAHSREELVDLLWPGVTLAVGRNRLRQALSTLKSLLEPAGVPGATVLQADRLAVRVVRGALACDAVDFERLARAGRADEALALYAGELMPGYYDEWIEETRQRLAALHEPLQARAGSAAGAASALASAAPSAARHAPPAPAVVAATLSSPLPTYLTRLFGADMAAARLRAAVFSHRLVTLLGPGGSGKTRLVVEVAHALRQFDAPSLWPTDSALAGAAHPPFERIAFVSLVACEDAAQLHDAIARALPMAGGSADDLAPLLAALAGQRVLLVLDNFEQLVGRAEGLVAELQARLPALHVLVTSRRALGLDGECCIGVEPLALPAADATLAVAAANPAVALFVDRARATRTDFHLGERNHAAIVALVRALHGMPLAIELAASRVRSFPPAEMVSLLSAGEGSGGGVGGGVGGVGGAHLALLARGGPRSGHDPRHASMAQVIAWSWRLLDAPAQLLLGALTQFPSDAGVAAVAAVVDMPVAAAAALLDDLVAHSLVRTAIATDGAADGAPRFGLVEPVREFVAAWLPAAQAHGMRARLRGWLIAWARALGPSAAPTRVAPELATVHAVLAGAAAAGAPRDALALALALRNYWEADTLPGGILVALEAALAAVDDAPTRADVLELLAYLRFEAGFVAQAQAHAEAAITAAGSDPSRRARALVRRAWVEIAVGRGDTEATPRHARLQTRLQEALELARSCADREAQARALQQLAVLAMQVERNVAKAEALFEQSQALWLALGDRRKAYARLRNRAQCWTRMGRQADATAAYAACEQAARDDGDWVGQIDTLLSQSALLAWQHHWPEALAAYRSCVALCWQRWHRHGLGYALWNPPRVLARLRRPEPAMRLIGFAATFWAVQFGPLSTADLRYVRRVRGLVRAQVGAARTEALWLEGASMDLAAAVALALRA